jgi:preprotein translocase subunit SecD
VNRRYGWYLGVSVGVVVLSVAAVVAAGLTPVLGLDLQGGVSVVLAPCRVDPSDPTRCADQGRKPSDAAIGKALDIINNRINALGVAEPEVSRQGDNIVIDLPGVRNRDKARRVVGQTAELRFRPVLAIVPPASVAGPGAPTTTSAPTTTTSPATTDPSATTAPATPTTTTPATTTTTLPYDPAAARAAIASCDPQQVLALPRIPSTSQERDRRDACVVLPGRDGAESARYYLGPAALTGSGVRSARARFLGGTDGWVVLLRLNGDGRDKFNALAKESYPKEAPQNSVAIVLDSVVQSAPAFRTDTFDGDVQISGDFTETEARDLATVLQYGALPVNLRELTAQTVSPTLGKDQLRAGIAAGIIGLALVAAYMLAYYRVLGLVVIVGLLLVSGAIYALVAYLGDRVGLTLTLAGVTGLIVSVGVTVDSYVVYFERLKDEVRTGKTIRSSVDRGFARSFRTIVAADLVSLIGAAILYFLAIGAVRGFAFYLGLAAALDLAVSYFFMHPLVYFMVRNRGLVTASRVGIGAGLDARGATA